MAAPDRIIALAERVEGLTVDFGEVSTFNALKLLKEAVAELLRAHAASMKEMNDGQ